MASLQAELVQQKDMLAQQSESLAQQSNLVLQRDEAIAQLERRLQSATEASTAGEQGAE